MKTTLNIHDTLLIQAKELAARERSTLTKLIEEGLRLRLRSEQLPASSTRPPMPVFRAIPSQADQKGLAPGLSGLSTREMLDWLDCPEHAA